MCVALSDSWQISEVFVSFYHTLSQGEGERSGLPLEMFWVCERVQLQSTKIICLPLFDHVLNEQGLSNGSKLIDYLDQWVKLSHSK